MSELLVLFVSKRAEIGTRALAEALNMTDGAVRMVCTGHYPNPKLILDKFARQYVDVVLCPHVGLQIERTECVSRSAGPRPFGGAAKQAWWAVCQDCEHRGGV